MSTNFPWPTGRFQSRRLSADDGDADVADRQDRLPGFVTADFARKSALLVGAGGFGSAIAGPLTRKGIGKLTIADPDLVELSNLNRQDFGPDDLHQSKAICLARNAARQGCLGTQCVGHQVAFTEQTADVLAADADVAIVGVDNNLTRQVACCFFRRRRKPVIFAAVNDQADYGWVFVQERSGVCLGCVFPKLAEADRERQRCQPVPAVVDILQVAGGIVLYATDSLVMQRHRHWNFRSVHLVGGSPDLVNTVQAKPDCPMCQGGDRGVFP